MLVTNEDAMIITIFSIEERLQVLNEQYIRCYCEYTLVQ